MLALQAHGPACSAIGCPSGHVYSPKQRDGDPQCGIDIPLDVIQVELLRVKG